MRCKKRTCPSCGVLWAGDTRTRLLTNLIEGYGHDVALLTITPPGSEVFTHDEHGVVLREQAMAWNRPAPRQWSRLNKATRRLLSRANIEPPLMLGYVWAFQKRGVLHLHVAFGARTPADRWAIRCFVGCLKGTAAAHLGVNPPAKGTAHVWGFGFVDLQLGRAGSKGLASYLAKYVCKEGASGRPELAETVDHEDVPKRPIYISPRLTATTRCTMRNLRLRRYYWRASTMRHAGAAECWYVEDLWQRGITVHNGKLRRPARAP